MIRVNLEAQLMGCTVCRAEHPIARRVLRDPFALVHQRETTERDHRECAANPDNPRMAKASRQFRKRTEREMRRLARRSRAKAASAAVPTTT